MKREVKCKLLATRLPQNIFLQIFYYLPIGLSKNRNPQRIASTKISNVPSVFQFRTRLETMSTPTPASSTTSSARNVSDRKFETVRFVDNTLDWWSHREIIWLSVWLGNILKRSKKWRRRLASFQQVKCIWKNWRKVYFYLTMLVRLCALT